MFVLLHKIRKQILYKMCQKIVEIYSVFPWHPTGLVLYRTVFKKPSLTNLSNHHLHLFKKTRAHLFYCSVYITLLGFILTYPNIYLWQLCSWLYLEVEVARLWTISSSVEPSWTPEVLFDLHDGWWQERIAKTWRPTRKYCMIGTKSFRENLVTFYFFNKTEFYLTV